MEIEEKSAKQVVKIKEGNENDNGIEELVQMLNDLTLEVDHSGADLNNRLKLLKVKTLVCQTKQSQDHFDDISHNLKEQLTIQREILQLKKEKAIDRVFQGVEDNIANISSWIILGLWLYAILTSLPSGTYDFCKIQAEKLASIIIPAPFLEESYLSFINPLAEALKLPLRVFATFAIYALLLTVVVVILNKISDGKSAILLMVILSVLVLYLSPVYMLSLVFYSILRTIFFVVIQRIIVSLYFQFIRQLKHRNVPKKIFYPVYYLSYLLPLIGLAIGLFNNSTWRANFSEFEHRYFIANVRYITYILFESEI